MQIKSIVCMWFNVDSVSNLLAVFDDLGVSMVQLRRDAGAEKVRGVDGAAALLAARPSRHAARLRDARDHTLGRAVQLQGGDGRDASVAQRHGAAVDRRAPNLHPHGVRGRREGRARESARARRRVSRVSQVRRQRALHSGGRVCRQECKLLERISFSLCRRL